jgi:hypothetical protein
MATACEACKKQQPALLKNVTHGTGPDSNWDYLIVSIAAVIVIITLYYSVKWLIRPGEQSPNHIKQLVITR